MADRYARSPGRDSDARPTSKSRERRWAGRASSTIRISTKVTTSTGLRLARKLLLDIDDLGVPTASEFLDTQIPQHIADLTSWVTIGARTAESQVHRELASGFSAPGRVQEQHRWQHPDCRGCRAQRAIAALVSLGDQAGRGGDLPDRGATTSAT